MAKHPRSGYRVTLTVGAVKVGKAKHVRSAALSGAVESAAGGVGLTLLNRSGGGDGNAGEDGSEGNSELHCDCGRGLDVFVCVCLNIYGR